MNLKEVYEIFYPGKCKENPSVWNVPPKYRSKKDFFEELLPMEIRWINCKIWNDKARRSRFFSNCKGETRYIASLRTFLFEQPWTISRIEGKANDLLSGQICEKVMNESYDDMSRLWAVKLNILFMIFDIVMGILLLKKKTTKMAYILAITELVYVVLVFVLGGTIGTGAIALLLALAGAIRIDKKWKQYQEISGGSNQLNHTGNTTARTTQNNTYTEIHTSETVNNGSSWQQAEKNNDFVSADSHKSLEETLNIYKKEKSWSAENDMIETLKNSKVWVPYISEKNQLDILKNGERYYLPVFTRRAEMKEYGKKFSQRELRFSDVMDMAKRSQYTLTGLVINAFTDSVILDWNQLGTINSGGDDEEEETMYTR